MNSFALEGLGAIRSLVGGNWLDDGLQLITKAGPNMLVASQRYARHDGEGLSQVGELFDCPGAAPVKGSPRLRHVKDRFLCMLVRAMGLQELDD